MSKFDLFLSYSSREAEIAERIGSRLRDDFRLEVWLDKWQIVAGDRITQRVGKGLRESSFLVLLLSENSIHSRWVEREWQEKFGEEIKSDRTMIICVLLDDSLSNSLPPFLQDKRFVIYKEDPSFYKEIANAIQVHKQREATAQDDESRKSMADLLKSMATGGLAGLSHEWYSSLRARIGSNSFVPAENWPGAFRYARALVMAEVMNSEMMLQELDNRLNELSNMPDGTSATSMAIKFALRTAVSTQYQETIRFGKRCQMEIDQLLKVTQTVPQDGKLLWESFLQSWTIEEKLALDRHTTASAKLRGDPMQRADLL